MDGLFLKPVAAQLQMAFSCVVGDFTLLQVTGLLVDFNNRDCVDGRRLGSSFLSMGRLSPLIVIEDINLSKIAYVSGSRRTVCLRNHG